MQGGLSEREELRVDKEVERLAERAFGFLERLVAQPSTLGQERGAQIEVAEELARLGFAVRWVEIPEQIAADPLAGVPRQSYADRHVVYGTTAAESRPRLLLNGHIDVVPAEDRDLWSLDPFRPQRRDGWLYGRGAGDMKCGFAMASLALDALRTAGIELPGPLGWVSAPEEECTGNGTLAAARAGILGDAVLLMEPTGLDILVAGIGILWLDIDVIGGGGHAEAADRSGDALAALNRLLGALRRWEAQVNAEVEDAVFDAVVHPYNVNIGQVHSGDWNSSQPARARAGVRIGFPRSWSPEQAQARVRAVILDEAAADPWLAENPPVVTATGYRAQGYALDPRHPLVDSVAAAHRAAHGDTPQAYAIGSTTDARYYVNEFGIPALCYGPNVRNMHGVDEAVELSSIVAGARSLARFIPAFLADGLDAAGARNGEDR